MNPGRRVEVYQKAKLTRFSAKKAGDLSSALRHLDAVTTVQSAVEPEELQLDDEGKTKEGYTFTRAAFNQVAQIIAPGLSKFIPDITGTTVLPDDRERLVDGVRAVEFWNELVDLRFSLFTNQRIIRNTEERTIEGIVGHKHQFLGNWELYREVVETLAGYDQHRDVTMFAAVLVGRRFSVWFRNPKPLFTRTVDDKPWPFYYGYYFTNGEATGTAVRGTLAVFNRAGPALAAYRKFGRRVTHTGKDFRNRVNGMVNELAEAKFPTQEIEDGFDAMMTQSLGFEASWNETQRKEQIKKLIHSLSLLGVAKNLATEVVEAGLSKGRWQGEHRPPILEVSRLYATRTLLDLFVTLLWIARRVDLSRREKMEQAAYEIQAGRFLL